MTTTNNKLIIEQRRRRLVSRPSGDDLVDSNHIGSRKWFEEGGVGIEKLIIKQGSVAFGKKDIGQTVQRTEGSVSGDTVRERQ